MLVSGGFPRERESEKERELRYVLSVRRVVVVVICVAPWSLLTAAGVVVVGVVADDVIFLRVIIESGGWYTERMWYFEFKQHVLIL